MHKSILFFVLACFSFHFSQAQGGSCSVNPEGIYVAKVDTSLNVYLKFFGKDSVVSTASEVPVNMANKVINKDNKKFILHGTYKIKRKCFITMKLEGMDGKAKLEGYIINQNIGLYEMNLLNNTFTDLFFFYKEN